MPFPKKKTTTAELNKRIDKYGVQWEATNPALWIEMCCIKKGGQWKTKSGKIAGDGLFVHFKRAIAILWPEIKQHRWFDFILEHWLKHTYVGIIGPKNSGKTHCAAVFHLMDYYCFPSETTVLVCSTTKEMLENRIWGEIKKFHKLAVQRYSWIPGHLIEGRQRIVTDDRMEGEEGRDFRCGMMGIPLKKGNQFVGISDIIGIKNKRKRLCGDELQCVVGKTLITTPKGLKRIDAIKVGDCVSSAASPNDLVLKVFKRKVENLIRLKLSNGKFLLITENHKVFTSFGWKKACEVDEGYYILSAYEAMCCLWENDPTERTSAILQELPASKGSMQRMFGSFPTSKEICKSTFLQSALSGEMDAQVWRQGFQIKGVIKRVNEVLQKPPRTPTKTISSTHRFSMVDKGSFGLIKNNESQRHKTTNKGRKRQWSNQTRKDAYENVSCWNLELRNKNGKVERKWLSPGVQNRPRVSTNKTGNRSRRIQPQQSISPVERFQEGFISSGAWVESVEILEQGNPEFPKDSDGNCYVYNLHIEKHPSYEAEGVLVHNCLVKAFIDGTANFIEPGADCKVTGMGNPAETTDSLGVLCEPHVTLGGWEGGIDQTPKTKAWRTRFDNGICIQLPGSDSPNNDVPEEDEIPFPFLMTRDQMAKDAATWGKDDWHYTMFNEGRMPRGQGSRRIITRQLCLKNHALEEPIWLNSKRKYVTALDAAYRSVGGDRCVLMRLAFGPESNSDTDEGTKLVQSIVDQSLINPEERIILAILDTIIIPIKAGDFESPEDQITMFCKVQHEQWRIGPEDFFFDAGMRTSLVSSMAKLWSPQVNTIDFGGKPSERPVSSAIDVSCRDYYSKFVTELWYSSRLLIEAEQLRGLTESIMMEGCAREWKMVSGNKIEVETKAEMKVKTGQSPDLYDTLVIGIEGARRKGLVIRRLSTKEVAQQDTRWKKDLKDKAKTLWHGKQLVHS